MTKSLNTNWTDQDFEVMDWHDNFIDSISFPSENLILKLNIDYILEWIKPDNEELYQFKVALAKLEFYNVLNLTIDLAFSNTACLYIDEILRSNRRLSPNRKGFLWDYKIKTDKGSITFDSTGFTQTLISQPQISHSQRFMDA